MAERGLFNIIGSNPVDKTAEMAQRHGKVDNLELLHHAPGDLHASLMSLKGHHAREIFHLRLGECVLGMRGKARIEHPLDGRVAFKAHC